MAQIGPCQAVIISLTNLTQIPTVEGAGTLKALRDPSSMQAASIVNPVRNDGGVTLDGSGNPTVKVGFYASDASAEVTTPTCDADPAPEPEFVDYSLDMYRQKSMDISVARLQTLCGDAAATMDRSGGVLGDIKFQNTENMQEVANMFMPIIRRLVAEVDQALLTRLATKIGFNSRMAIPDATAQTVNLFDANGNLRADGFTTVMQDLQYNEVMGTPIILGGGLINRFRLGLGWACCSDAGWDYAKINSETGNRFYFDRRVDSTLATNDFLVMAPGSAIALSRSRYKIKGQTEYQNGTSYYSSFTLPQFPGFVFDLVADQSGCVTPGTRYIISASFGLYTTPATVFGAGDVLNGVNGIFRYKGVAA